MVVAATLEIVRLLNQPPITKTLIDYGRTPGNPDLRPFSKALPDRHRHIIHLPTPCVFSIIQGMKGAQIHSGLPPKRKLIRKEPCLPRGFR
eukprot:scaffold45807_cov13-Tisochrysis_lutea.AAC.1